MIATGQQLVIFGRVKRKGLRLLIDHPEFEVIEDDEEILIHFRRITPIYPATEGLSQRVLRGLIFRLLEQVDVASADVPLPDSLGNGDDENALRKIHFPESDEQLREVRDAFGARRIFPDADADRGGARGKFCAGRLPPSKPRFASGTIHCGASIWSHPCADNGSLTRLSAICSWLRR